VLVKETLPLVPGNAASDGLTFASDNIPTAKIKAANTAVVRALEWYVPIMFLAPLQVDEEEHPALLRNVRSITPFWGWAYHPNE
jgi:hypothetical protein